MRAHQAKNVYNLPTMSLARCDPEQPCAHICPAGPCGRPLPHIIEGHAAPRKSRQDSQDFHVASIMYCRGQCAVLCIKCTCQQALLNDASIGVISRNYHTNICSTNYWRLT